MGEENALLAGLESLLAHEYGLLQTRDAEGLESAAKARQQCVTSILRIEDERRALCRANVRSDGPAALHSLLAWCDPTGLLWSAIQEYRERTLRCREQNDRNGMLVNARLQPVSGQPKVHGARQGGSYGPDSGNDHSHSLTTRA
jgi:flagellar biosynthesis/type III secretory pathway chaperone